MAESKPHISIAAETVHEVEQLPLIDSFPITNAIIMSWITMAILLIMGFLFVYKIKIIPRKMQNVGELILDTGLDFVTNILGSRQKAEKVFPLIITLFLFILISNWMGLVPGIGSIGVTQIHEGKEVFIPFFRSVFADINMTLALGIIAVVATHIFAIINIGKKAHIGKFINFKSPILFFVGILELFGEISKIISFSFRLFGNVFAGEVLLVIILWLTGYYLASIPFYGLELFVGFIQALVFSMLTLIFIQVATMEPEH